MRVVSGNTIGTTWTSVGITEGGVILPEAPEGEPPANMEYVKTESGENAAPYLRAGTNGLQFSPNGMDWEDALSGIPDVPQKPDGKRYVRTRGDWVEADEPDVESINEKLTQMQEALQEARDESLKAQIAELKLLCDEKGKIWGASTCSPTGVTITFPATQITMAPITFSPTVQSTV